MSEWVSVSDRGSAQVIRGGSECVGDCERLRTTGPDEPDTGQSSGPNYIFVKEALSQATPRLNALFHPFHAFNPSELLLNCNVNRFRSLFKPNISTLYSSASSVGTGGHAVESA